MIGVVLAGGASRRFGGRPKGLAMLAGKPMALCVAEMLARFCTSVAIEAPPDAGYEALGLPLVQALAEHGGKGPLAGLAAGLGSTLAAERVAFSPCDMPFLTLGIYDALAKACDETCGAYAASPNGVEPLVAILNVNMRGALLEALANSELPRTHAVLDRAGALSVFFEQTAPFTNINTAADLAAAEVRRRGG
jgi:molybdopterin-guanine dinucleotide biosynthesis protein A